MESVADIPLIQESYKSCFVPSLVAKQGSPQSDVYKK
jgi:hypothetical protein